MPASKSLSLDISDQISERIAKGELMAGDRLPSEAELAQQFDCSRGTVREALKRLAARNLIRTRRGHAGGAFVNALTFAAAIEDHAAQSTLLLSMNAVDFETAAEARFTLEAACADLACANHDRKDMAALKKAVDRMSQPCDDVDFCAHETAFHCAYVDACKNPVLSYHLAGAVQAMAPLMNMITFAERDREAIIRLHRRMAGALQGRSPNELRHVLRDLEAAMTLLFHRARDRRRGT